MGAFSDIFGKVPKVLILEMFAENPNDELTVKDIIDQTGVSKRGTYLILKKFKEVGLLTKISGRPQKYMLNRNDLRALTLIRAEPLLIMGKLEYEIKLDDNIPLTMPYQNYDNDIANGTLEYKTYNTYLDDAERSDVTGDIKTDNEQFSLPVGA